MTFINRHEWGARDPEPGPGFLNIGRVQGVALHWPAAIDHHPGVDEFGTIAVCKTALRSWQDFHMDDKGWSDIAYQLAFDQDGNVYKLRGLKTQSAANGDVDVNEKYGAFLLMVAIGEKPSDALIHAVRNRCARFRDRYPNARQIVPHSAIRPEPTDCPGDKIRALIDHGAFTPPKRKP